MPEGGDQKASTAYQNTLTRFIAIKEERADLAKHHLLVLWTDYFKPQHLEKYPDLHDLFWKSAKLCSAVKQEISLEHAQELMDNIKRVHEIFWETKGKDVPWYTAS
jgi:nickel superoxide dismutase